MFFLIYLFLLFTNIKTTHAIKLSQYDFSSCQDPLTFESIQITQDYAPKHIRNQREKQTCYAFAAQFLLNYYTNKERKLTGHKQEIPSVLDLINLYKHGSIDQPDFGYSSDIFRIVASRNYYVKADRIDSKGEGDYERYYYPSNPDEAKAPEQKRRRRDSTIQIPPYQVHSIALTGEDDETTVSPKIEKILRSDYPAIITLALDGDHATVVTGMRKVCCGTNCHNEIQILDSLPESQVQETWFLNETLDYVTEITFLSPPSDAPPIPK